jgi:hypothetical protein
MLAGMPLAPLSASGEPDFFRLAHHLSSDALPEPSNKRNERSYEKRHPDAERIRLAEVRSIVDRHRDAQKGEAHHGAGFEKRNQARRHACPPVGSMQWARMVCNYRATRSVVVHQNGCGDSWIMAALSFLPVRRRSLVPIRTSIIHSLLRRLRYNAESKPIESRARENWVASSEQEQIVRVALLPDPSKAIDATLEHLYPAQDRPGFTTVLHLEDVDQSLQSIVRKVLSAGSAINMVLADDEERLTYHVHGDFYKMLARLRSEDHHLNTLGAVLENELREGRVEKATPTKADIGAALDDVASGLSEFVILARTSRHYPDYIQTAGPSPFRVECRIWFNDDCGEHFQVLDPKDPENGHFAEIDDVKDVMVHWLCTGGRLPPAVKVRNITAELD